MYRKILTVVGARPQFIKAAPVSRALAEVGLQEILVHTGQHFDALMSDTFFEELGIPAPAYNLEVNNLGHGAMTGRMLEKLEEVMIAEKPDVALIYGDTNSTLAGALAAAKLNIPVAHVEAGLRSFNRKMPEEINRVLADHISTALFCPTLLAMENLQKEGITAGVHHVGDVMYDVALGAQRSAEQLSSILKNLELVPKSYAVATLHRAENTDDPARFKQVLEWLTQAGRECPIVMPVHPRTRNTMEQLNLWPQNVRLIDPLGYLDMVLLTRNAVAVYTDSGGLQKEAYFHRVPCVTLRDETEWVETVEAGWNRLWTTAEFRPRREIAEYGDGHSSARIAKILQNSL
jgi:UDP-GlcNAc3NAcA epimerase